jgi:hypothetical protein
MNRPDDFRIDLLVRHPSANPSTISGSLRIQPEFAWGVGDLLGGQPRTSSLWRATLAEGSGPKEFERALESVLSLMSDRNHFLSQTVASGGELSLTVRTFAETQNGKASEVHLNAPFLGTLAAIGIDLIFEVWMQGQEVEE